MAGRAASTELDSTNRYAARRGPGGCGRRPGGGGRPPDRGPGAPRPHLGGAAGVVAAGLGAPARAGRPARGAPGGDGRRGGAGGRWRPRWRGSPPGSSGPTTWWSATASWPGSSPSARATPWWWALGCNVNWEVPARARGDRDRVQPRGRPRVDRDALLDAFLAALADALDDPLATERRRLPRLLVTLGRTVRVELTGGEVLEGEAVGLGVHGELEVCDADGVVHGRGRRRRDPPASRLVRSARRRRPSVAPLTDRTCVARAIGAFATQVRGASGQGSRSLATRSSKAAARTRVTGPGASAKV